MDLRGIATAPKEMLLLRIETIIANPNSNADAHEKIKQIRRVLEIEKKFISVAHDFTRELGFSVEDAQHTKAVALNLHQSHTFVIHSIDKVDMTFTDD